MPCCCRPVYEDPAAGAQIKFKCARTTTTREPREQTCQQLMDADGPLTPLQFRGKTTPGLQTAWEQHQRCLGVAVDCQSSIAGPRLPRAQLARVCPDRLQPLQLESQALSRSPAVAAGRLSRLQCSITATHRERGFLLWLASLFCQQEQGSTQQLQLRTARSRRETWSSRAESISSSRSGIVSNRMPVCASLQIAKTLTFPCMPQWS